MAIYNRNTIVFFWVTIITIVLCVVLITLYSGFRHEEKKLQTFILTLLLALLICYLVFDVIKFFVLALDAAVFPHRPRRFKTDRESTKHSRLEYLKLKLAALKSKKLITEQHRNEELNNSYRHVLHDLWLYGKYFILLFLLVLVTRDELLYINTRFLTNIFYRNASVTYGIDDMIDMEQLTDYIKSALVYTFDTVLVTGETGFEYAPQDKLLGVIRLRQLRTEHEHIGLGPPDFSYGNFMPDWKKPYKYEHYQEFYWRVFEPFQAQDDIIHYDWLHTLLLRMDDTGQFYTFPNTLGYATPLARNSQNSLQIIDYLTHYNWITSKTTVIFIDFTLYNVDVDIFSIITLIIEQTPFGLSLPEARIGSFKLLENLDNLPLYGLLVLLLYILVVIQFAKALAVKIWFDHHAISNWWNRIDLIICILNVFLLLLILLREWMVYKMVRKIEGSSKMEFIDFRLPARLSTVMIVSLGILVAITTIRLWKSMQFANVFKLFTHTLYHAWKSFVAIALVIIIFLFAIGIALDVINGNNSISFNKVIKSVITCMCFSFGFSSQIHPDHLFVGGIILGFIAYVILTFVIVILLINVFVSLINEYFAAAKTTSGYDREGQINVLQFLRVEYNDCVRCFTRWRCCQSSYHRRNRTVRDNVENTLNTQEKRDREYRRRNVLARLERKPKQSEEMIQQKYRLKIERMFAITDILSAQLDILYELLFEKSDKEKKDAENDDVYVGIEEDQYDRYKK